jgi:isopentenyldiphosphate isomerase
MSTEMFDVVNERDEVIGTRSREEVHRLGLMHRAVHVLVFNARGEVFLQQRSWRKDRQPNLWDSSASGHVDTGEGYDNCAVRELREEIGLSLPRQPDRLFKISACPRTDQEHVWVYRCESEGPFVLNEQEIEQGGWFDSLQLARWIAEWPADFSDAFLLIWEEIMRGKQTARDGSRTASSLSLP